MVEVDEKSHSCFAINIDYNAEADDYELDLMKDLLNLKDPKIEMLLLRRKIKCEMKFIS